MRFSVIQKTIPCYLLHRDACLLKARRHQYKSTRRWYFLCCCMCLLKAIYYLTSTHGRTCISLLLYFGLNPTTRSCRSTRCQMQPIVHIALVSWASLCTDHVSSESWWRAKTMSKQEERKRNNVHSSPHTLAFLYFTFTSITHRGTLFPSLIVLHWPSNAAGLSVCTNKMHWLSVHCKPQAEVELKEVVKRFCQFWTLLA